MLNRGKRKAFQEMAVILSVTYMIFTVISMTLLKTPFFVFFKYFVSICICIIVPGMSIMIMLGKYYAGVGLFCYSYLIGTAMDVVLYFVCAFLKILQYSNLVMITISTGLFACAVDYLRRDSKNDNQSIDNRMIGSISTDDGRYRHLFVFLSILVLYLLSNILIYSAGFRSPHVNGLTNAFEHTNDLYYWASNSAALKLKWPAEYLFVDGLRLNYHYFSSIHVAWMSLISGIDIFSCSSVLYAYGKAVVFLSAFYVFFISFVKSENLMWIFLAMSLFANGFSYYTHVTYSGIMSSPIGLDVGYAYSAVSLAMYFVYRKDRHKKNFVLALLFWFMAVGSKMPVAAIILLVPCGFMIYDIWKKDRSAIALNLLYLFLFLLIGYFCVGMFTVLGMTGSEKRGWFLGLQSLAVYQNGIIEGGGLVGIIVNIVYLVMCYPAIFLILNIIVAFKERKLTEEHDFKVWLLFVVIGTGIILYVILDAGNGAGNSRYFLYATYILSWYIVATEWEDGMADVCSNKGKRQIIDISLLFFILLHAFGYFKKTGLTGEFIFTYLPATLIITGRLFYKRILEKSQRDTLLHRVCENSWGTLLAVSLWCGISYAVLIYDQPSGGYLPSIIYNVKACFGGNAQQEFDYLELTESDVEALYWIRDNTEREAVIMDDVTLISKWNRMFCYGVYSERQMFLDASYMIDAGNYPNSYKQYINERKEIINRAYFNDAEAWHMIKKSGVTYIIQNMRVSSQFQPAKEYAVKVFENESMRVYKIR